MAKKKPEEAAPGSPAWMATFSDLMNLLLCFFVLLFSMSSIDAQKFELVAASFANTFSIFTAGGQAVGDGIIISNGVRQLSQLDEYLNSTDKAAESDKQITDTLEEFDNQRMAESEEMAELIEETITEAGMENLIDIEFTSQYVQLTLNGSLLFDSGSATLKEESIPVLDQIIKILQRYPSSIIEVEGHTDNVPMTNGRYADNDELSSARAISVFKYITENSNIDPSMIKHSGRGEYNPIADNSTAEGRSLNRRVEIKIYNTLSSF
jgi:chemotaxis protein MotB